MSYEVWASFCIASLILCFTPGPTVLVVIGQSIKHGKRSAIPLVLGVLAGDVVAMTLSLVGLGAVIASSAVLFSLVKWGGALYLFYLGYQSWVKSGESSSSETLKAVKNSHLFTEAFVVTALNPKAIMFFIAFFPLFITPTEALMPQLVVLVTTLLFFSAVSVLFFALSAGHLGGALMSPRFQKIFGRASASILVGAGMMTAFLSQ